MRYEIVVDALIIAATAHTFINILTRPSFPLAWWATLNEWVSKKVSNSPRLGGFVAQLQKPLLTCSYCCAGQIALWFYFITSWGVYNVFEHIALVSVSIALVQVIGDIVGTVKQQHTKRGWIPPEAR